MILSKNDDSKIAYVRDWDQASWDVQKYDIPSDYKIEFEPSVDFSVIDSIREGREVFYEQRTIYITEWIDNTRIVRPEIIFVQQLLPLPTSGSN